MTAARPDIDPIIDITSAWEDFAIERNTSKIREYVRGIAEKGPAARMKRSEQAKFLSLLGCPYLDIQGDLGLVIPQLRLDNVEVVGNSLVKVLSLAASNLRSPVCDVASVLSGLYRHDCWSLCLKKESTTYAMAAAILEFVETCLPVLRLDNYAAKDICKLLNEWLKPLPPWNSLPSADDLASRLFGAAWRLFLPSEVDIGVGELVYQERPPFLPGLCPAQDGILSVPLPDDAGFSL